ncbi:hypothetical protein JXL21_09190 [Candidatus Bathyarchaeota archaeon]|nr:hypothetical protein [Candidatus Bathyarchaeota archaeon]
MEGRLHPGDHELLHGGEVPRWRNQAEHMLDGLVEEGYVTERNGWLKATDRARRYLSDQTESL